MRTCTSPALQINNIFSLIICFLDDFIREVFDGLGLFYHVESREFFSFNRTNVLEMFKEILQFRRNNNSNKFMIRCNWRKQYNQTHVAGHRTVFYIISVTSVIRPSFIFIFFVKKKQSIGTDNNSSLNTLICIIYI